MTNGVRRFITKPVSRYSSGVRYIHWAMAAGVLGSFALVEVSKRIDKKNPLRWKILKYHKSIGLVLMGLVVLRVGVRLTSKIPAAMPGVPSVMTYAGHATHLALYSMMIFMPVTGILMGYFGTKGLPFFDLYQIAPTKTPNKTISSNAYKYHKKVGTVFEILVGAHLGGVAFHMVRGDAILARMSLLSAPVLYGLFEIQDMTEDESARLQQQILSPMRMFEE